MSNLRHQASFSIVMGLDKPPERSPDEWSFIFGPGDMAAMHGSMGRLAEMGGILGLSRALRSDLRDGLLRDEVDQGTFMKRQRKFGINVFPKPPLTPFLELCWNAWHDPIMMLLTFSGFFSLIVRTVESPSHGFVEGLAILLAILTVVLVQAGNNFKQERAFRALDNSKAEEVVKVWRGGVQMRVPESQVYVGDLVELSAGDSVPADGVYIFGDDPAVNEAKMTGESKDIEKNAASPFLLGGTELKRGALFYLATAVGPNSAYGRIMAALAKPPEETPLQEKLAHMATQISKVGAITAAAMFVISMIYWGVDLDKTGDSFRSRGAEIIDFVIISITILVVAVPEGLPLAVTLSLAYSMNKMVEDKCLVRILSACETMGNATAICSDKTGTLTQNKMTVTTGYLSGILYKKIPAVPIWGTDAKDIAQSNIRKLLVQTAVVNSKATQESDQPVAAALAHKEVLMDDAVSLHDREDSTSSVPLVELNGKNGNHDWALNKAGALDLERPGGNSGGAAGKPKQVNGGGAQKPTGGKTTGGKVAPQNKEDAPEPGKKVWKGNQTEIALMEWLTGWGVDIYRERAHCPVEKNYPFDSMKKNSSVIIRQRVNNQMGFRRCYKGASEQILGLCTHVLDKDENEVPIDQFRAEVNEVIHGMTTTGLRTIGFCYEDHQHIDHDPKDANKLADPPAADKVVFVGVVGIKDPLRPESRASVRTCQRAGVVVRMVTGDHPETAKFIAQECGILTAPHHEVMTGSDFRLMVENSPDEAERRIPNLRVLARSSPTDKQVLVKWLKDRGHCVAATGDGTNDAPALKEADVGIAMFIAGTTVAKQAASILILDDNFASIVKSVMWGRSIFDNVRKFVQFQLTINVVALTVSLIGALSDYAKPLSAVQLLWVNLIMDSLAALSLGTELPTTKLLDRKPYDRNGPLLSHLMWRNILGHAVFQIALLLMILYKGADIWGVENKGGVHYTLIFNTFVFLQIFNEFNSRQVSPDPEGKLATLFSPYGHLFNNATFWYVFVAMIGMQIMMVELFGSFAQTSPLNPRQWLACVGLGALSMPWGLIVRSIDTDPNQGMVVVPPETFEGANLEVHEENEIGHPNYADYLKRQEEEEAKRAAIAAGSV